MLGYTTSHVWKYVHALENKWQLTSTKVGVEEYWEVNSMFSRVSLYDREGGIIDIELDSVGKLVSAKLPIAGKNQLTSYLARNERLRSILHADQSPLILFKLDRTLQGGMKAQLIHNKVQQYKPEDNKHYPLLQQAYLMLLTGNALSEIVPQKKELSITAFSDTLPVERCSVYITRMNSDRNIVFDKDYVSYILSTTLNVNEMLTLNTYLAYVSQFPLLTHKQEQIIFAHMRNGNTIDALLYDDSFINEIPEKYIYHYIKLFQESNSFEDLLYRCSMRLVVNIAKKYQHTNIHMMDLIQEGNLGLFTAIQTLNTESIEPFSTLVHYDIEDTISYSTAGKSDIIKIPKNVFYALRHVYRYLQDNEYTVKDLPSIVQKLGIHPDLQHSVIHYLQNNIDTKLLSLERTISLETDQTLNEIVSDNNDFTESVMSRVEVHNLLKNLSIDEQRMIGEYYGLEGYIQKTLEELGAYYNILP